MATAENGARNIGERPTIEALRTRIRHLERGNEAGAAPLVCPPVCPVGLAAIDESLPAGGLSRSGVHEVAGPVEGRGDGAAMGFVLALAGRFAGMPETATTGGRIAIWIGPHDDLFAPALAPFGLNASALIRVRARGKGLLWALEEALRSGAAAAVVADCDGVDLTASRRLQLAAEAGRTPALLLRRRLMRHDGSDAGAAPIAAHTRWMVTSLGSIAETTAFGPVPGVGHAAWRLELVRSRGGRPGCWDVMWQGAGAGAGQGGDQNRGFSLRTARLGPIARQRTQPGATVTVAYAS